MQDRLTAPVRSQQELQRHLVSLDADLDGSLGAVQLPLLSEATLVLLQPADALLIGVLQGTNQS